MAGRPRSRRGCRKYVQSLVTIGVFGILLLAGAVWFFWSALQSPYRGYEEPAKRFEVRRGMRTATILRHLQGEGVLRDEYVPLIYMKLLRNRDSVKAGLYEFDRPMSAVDVLDKLIRGDVILESVTVREGLDRFAVGRLFAEAGFGTDEQWEAATSDSEPVRDIAPEAESLEGYLFPDTYKFAPGTPVPTIVRSMVDNFRRNFVKEMALIATGLSLHDTVILASIVETEARIADERPIVASVYVNRIRKNMLLGADPTVIYALKLDGRWDGNIRKPDLQIDSPYNTYRYRGLPPGPIANPGLASLRAASAPATTNLLYFVARQDGTHAFSTNLDEHNRNVEVYQRQFYRDQRKAAANAGR
ncbi:MAG TPA: endolytic transglycosylase MltG [Thermoanaerobaculia bacterium]|nr:endolytic transglycosylase MltG [Thermoanaerobaculia bacterium]